MAGPQDQDFAARLQALNAKFAASLPGIFARLADARARFDPAAPDAMVASELHQLLHSIAGSAATFGFPLLGQQARSLEQVLRTLQANPAADPGWTAWAGQFDHFLAWAQMDPLAPYTVPSTLP
jgi:HPt (histidine-containing phosphotransfer) domain-containing protein